MTDTAINKLDGARRLLDKAIEDYRNGEDSLPVHLVAHSAFQVLFNKCAEQHGTKVAVSTIRDRIGWDRFNRDANFLKHADKDPNGELPAHSLKSVYLYVALAIPLYRANGGTPTPEMLAFEQLPPPFKPGYFHDAAMEFLRRHRDDPCLSQVLSPDDEQLLKSDLKDIVTLATSGGSAT